MQYPTLLTRWTARAWPAALGLLLAAAVPPGSRPARAAEAPLELAGPPEVVDAPQVPFSPDFPVLLDAPGSDLAPLAAARGRFVYRGEEFDEGTMGWLFQGREGGIRAPRWELNGANGGGGCIADEGVGDWSAWMSTYRNRDMAGAYQRAELRFYAASKRGVPDGLVVALFSLNHRTLVGAVAKRASNPDTEGWVEYVIALDENAGWQHVADATPANAREMVNALSELTDIRISVPLDGSNRLDDVFIRGKKPLPEVKPRARPALLNFAKVPVGQTKTLTFIIANRGKGPLHLAIGAPSAGSPFTVAADTSNGLDFYDILPPGAAPYGEQVFKATFAPTREGSFHVRYPFLVGPPGARKRAYYTLKGQGTPPEQPPPDLAGEWFNTRGPGERWTITHSQGARSFTATMHDFPFDPWGLNRTGTVTGEFQKWVGSKAFFNVQVDMYIDGIWVDTATGSLALSRYDYPTEWQQLGGKLVWMNEEPSYVDLQQWRY